MARDRDLPNVVKLHRVLLGIDHLALEMEKYQMNFRVYLQKHRDYRQLPRMLSLVAEGLKQLHSLGYVHRDLKPENIVVNLKPLEVRLIDFNRAFLQVASTKGTVRGTPGYFPMKENLKDGSVYWDIWALAAIVLECEMELNSYMAINSERGTVLKLEKYLEEKDTCKHIRNLLRTSILVGRINEMITLDEMVELLAKCNFRKGV